MQVDKHLARDPVTKEFPAMNKFSQAFVACFCAVPDLLSQWRAYGRSGAGYCIAFDWEELARAGSCIGFELIRAIYDKSDQERIVATFMASAKAVYEEIPWDSVSDGSYWNVVLGTITKLALCFKHPSFSEEREWRLVSLSQNWLDTIPGRPMGSDSVFQDPIRKVLRQQKSGKDRPWIFV